MACRGARRRKNTSRRRSYSNRSLRSPKRSSQRKRRRAESCRSIRRTQPLTSRPAEPGAISRWLAVDRHRLKTATRQRWQSPTMRQPSERRNCVQARRRRKAAIAKTRRQLTRFTKKCCQRGIAAERQHCEYSHARTARIGLGCCRCYDRFRRRALDRCQRTGPTSVGLFRRRRAPSGRRAARTMVRL